MSNTPNTAIVTGASRGIGAAIARRLAADGFATLVGYALAGAQAQATVAAIVAAGGQAKAVQADVAQPKQVGALFDTAEQAFGPVDVLVNNAGVLRTGSLAGVSEDDFHLQVSTNLAGAFNGMREGARRIRRGGRIINLSTSIIGRYIPAHGVYAATKAAVEAMTHVLAKELGPKDITVNAVAPGPVATELLLSTSSEELLRRLASEIPMGRLVQPEDVARVVSFLAGPDGAWVSSQVIRVNGGRN